MSLLEFQKTASKPNTPLWHVGLNIQRCSQEFGVTCNGTGEPCHQAWNSCKDPCNFECVPEQVSHTNLPSNKFGLHIPDIDSIRFSNSKVQLFKGMPGSSSVQVTMSDTEGCDAIDDPHWANRTVRDQGTRLEKFHQRHNLEGRRVNVDGGHTQSDYPAGFLSRNYFVDSFTPSGNKWTLKADDALGFFDYEKSKHPLERETKLFEYLSPLHGKGHRITFDEAFGTGIRAVFINGEALLINFIITQTSGTRVFQRYEIVQRAVCGSTYNTDLVKAGTSVIPVGYYPEGTNITTVLLDYIFQGGTALIPEDRDDCDCGPMTQRTFDLLSLRRIEQGGSKVHTIGETLIPPTDTRIILDEIAQVFMIWPYVDPFDGVVYFHEFCPPHADEEIPLIDENIMIDCKVTKKQNKARRKTTTTVRAFPNDCTKGVTDENTNVGSFGINAGALGDSCTNPAWVPESPNEIKTRFISDYNGYMARKVEQRHNYVGRRIPREVTMKLHARDVPNKCTYRRLRHREIQNAYGDVSEVVWWVSGVEIDEDGYFDVTAEDSGFRTTQRWRTKRTCEGPGANIALGAREVCDNRECLLAW